MPCAARIAAARRATSSVTSFSLSPPGPTAPVSFPPCPGSSTMRAIARRARVGAPGGWCATSMTIRYGSCMTKARRHARPSTSSEIREPVLVASVCTRDTIPSHRREARRTSEVDAVEIEEGARRRAAGERLVADAVGGGAIEHHDDARRVAARPGLDAQDLRRLCGRRWGHGGRSNPGAHARASPHRPGPRRWRRALAAGGGTPPAGERVLDVAWTRHPSVRRGRRVDAVGGHARRELPGACDANRRWTR